MAQYLWLGNSVTQRGVLKFSIHPHWFRKMIHEWIPKSPQFVACIKNGIPLHPTTNIYKIHSLVLYPQIHYCLNLYVMIESQTFTVSDASRNFYLSPIVAAVSPISPILFASLIDNSHFEKSSCFSPFLLISSHILSTISMVVPAFSHMFPAFPFHVPLPHGFSVRKPSFRALPCARGASRVIIHFINDHMRCLPYISLSVRGYPHQIWPKIWYLVPDFTLGCSK